MNDVFQLTNYFVIKTFIKLLGFYLLIFSRCCSWLRFAAQFPALVIKTSIKLLEFYLLILVDPTAGYGLLPSQSF